jgi:hypothetical protein
MKMYQEDRSSFKPKEEMFQSKEKISMDLTIILGKSWERRASKRVWLG